MLHQQPGVLDHHLAHLAEQPAPAARDARQRLDEIRDSTDDPDSPDRSPRRRSRLAIIRIRVGRLQMSPLRVRGSNRTACFMLRRSHSSERRPSSAAARSRVQRNRRERPSSAHTSPTDV